MTVGAAPAGENAAQVGRMLTDLLGAFLANPNMVALAIAMALSAVCVIGFWLVRGTFIASAAARMALRTQALRNQRDHRASILIANIDGPMGRTVREDLKEAIEENFGDFTFQAQVSVDLFPTKLDVVGKTGNAERRRQVAFQATDLLERAQADVIVWGKRGLFSRKLELRIVAEPGPGRTPEVHALTLQWRPGDPGDGVSEAVAYACARRARAVLNRPQDYKPEKLQPIVEALDRLVSNEPTDAGDQVLMEILGDFASGALSLGERGGDVRWLQKALDARRMYLDRVDRTADPGAWGAAQQEVGRALAALGEREGARDKLEEAVAVLRQSLDALRATESLQHAEVALRALTRAEQTLQQRRRIGLRWPG